MRAGACSSNQVACEWCSAAAYAQPAKSGEECRRAQRRKTSHLPAIDAHVCCLRTDDALTLREQAETSYMLFFFSKDHTKHDHATFGVVDREC